MKLMQKKLNKKGFTLAELLIVVAIIAVLAAIAVPMFSAQLTKAKAGTDLANLRAAESVAKYTLLTNPNATTTAVEAAIDAALGADLKSQLTPVDGATHEINVVVAGGEITTLTLGGRDLTALEEKAKTGN